MKTVVPGTTANSEGRSDDAAVMPSSRVEISRYRQVLLTSFPLYLGDLAGLAGCYLAGVVAAHSLLGTPAYFVGLSNNLIAVCLCHVMLGTLLGLFPASGMNPVCELKNQLTSITGSFLVLIALNGLVGEVTPNEIIAVTVAFPLTLFICPSVRFMVRRAFGQFSWWGERVILVGNGKQARLIHQFIRNMPQRGLKPLGMVDDSPGEHWPTDTAHPFRYLGKTADLVQICRKNHCHWVIAAIADKSESQVREILSRGSLIPHLVVLSTNIMTPTLWVESFDAAGLAGLHIRDRLLCPFQRAAKRVTDVSLSIVLLILCSPLILALILYMKLTSPGPVFYKHHGRIGRNGLRIGVYKIRTMLMNSDELLEKHLASDPAARQEWERDLKLKKDPRVIPGIGQFLRRTSLDELPQLWNVIAGDMSLVGPRPIYTDIEVEKFKEMYPLYLRVRPGLTGLWQVSGRNNTSYEDRVRLDSYYVRNWSLWLDYFILLRTVRTVLLREGSY